MRLFEMWRADIRDAVFEGGCLAVWDMARAYGLLGTRDLAALRPSDFEMVDAGVRIPLTYDCVRNP
jgi:hypothetical protein